MLRLGVEFAATEPTTDDNKFEPTVFIAGVHNCNRWINIVIEIDTLLLTLSMLFVRAAYEMMLDIVVSVCDGRDVQRAFLWSRHLFVVLRSDRNLDGEARLS